MAAVLTYCRVTPPNEILHRGGAATFFLSFLSFSPFYYHRLLPPSVLSRPSVLVANSSAGGCYIGHQLLVKDTTSRVSPSIFLLDIIF